MKTYNFNKPDLTASPDIHLPPSHNKPGDLLGAQINPGVIDCPGHTVLNNLRAPSMPISIVSAERKRGALLEPNSLSAASELSASVCEQIIKANVCERKKEGRTMFGQLLSQVVKSSGYSQQAVTYTAKVAPLAVKSLHKAFMLGVKALSQALRKR
jgi:hypothetical protein